MKKLSALRSALLYPVEVALALVLLAGASGCGGMVEGAAATPSGVVGKNAITIYEAAKKGNLDALSYLIGDGVDIDAPDATGKTPLHYAAESGAGRAVRLLLVAGAKRDVVNADGRTPLEVAQAAGKAEAVKHLASESILP